MRTLDQDVALSWIVSVPASRDVCVLTGWTDAQMLALETRILYAGVPFRDLKLNFSPNHTFKVAHPRIPCKGTTPPPPGPMHYLLNPMSYSYSNKKKKQKKKKNCENKLHLAASATNQ